MAEGRRYTKEQIDRVVESGEKPPEDMGIVNRSLRNAAVAIPRTATDLAALAGVVPAFARSMFKGTEFSEEFLGKEGLQELGTYIESEVSKHVEQLPEEWRTQENVDRIRQAVVSSDAAFEKQLEYAPALYSAGMKGAGAINEFAGLNSPHQETTTDDIAQIVGSVILPIGLPGRAATTAAKAATRSTLSKVGNFAVEAVAPGTMAKNYTAGVVGGTAAVGLGVNQGLRAVTDQPSMVTGDAFGADSGVTFDTVPLDELESEVGSGLNAEQYAGIAGLTGGAATMAAILLGKTNKTIAKEAMDAVEQATRADPKVTRDGNGELGPEIQPGEPMQPTMTGADRMASGIDSSSAITRVAEKYETDPEVVKLIESADYEARVGGTQARINAAFDDGRFLDTEIIPIRRIQRSYLQLHPQDRELADLGMNYADMLDRMDTYIKSIDEEIYEHKATYDHKAITSDPKAANAYYSKLNALQTRRDNAPNGVEGKIPSRAEMISVVTRANSNPNVSTVMNMFRRTYSDILDIYTARGLIDAGEAARIKQLHPNYLPRKLDPNAGVTGVDYLKKSAVDLIAGKIDNNKHVFGNRFAVERAAEGEGFEALTAQGLKSPLELIGDYVTQMITFAQHNESRRTFVAAMEKSKGWNRAVREVMSPRTREQAEGRTPGHTHNYMSDEATRENVLAIHENGKVRLVEVADKEVARALRYDPESTAGVFNMTRRWFQNATTGVFAPWFAFTSAKYSYNMGSIRAARGRSMGAIDAFLRRSFPHQATVNAALDKLNVLDPTFRLQMLASMVSMPTARAVKAVGRQITEDLATQSGLFNLMARTPEGKQRLENAARAILRTYNETYTGMLDEQFIARQNWLQDPNTPIKPHMRKLHEIAPRAGPVLKFMMNRYIDVLEGIHNSATHAFFAQNMTVLRAKYGGFDRIPAKEVQKLSHEIKASFDVDMTRAPGNKTLNEITRAVPYSRIMVNSLNQFGQHIMKDPMNALPRIMLGYVAPKVVITYAILQSDTMRDWWYNKIPAWERQTRMPVIKPEYFADLVDGNERALTPDDVIMEPITPELVFFSNTVDAGLRALGLYGDAAAEHSEFASEFMNSISALIGVPMPPLINMITGGKTEVLGGLRGEDRTRIAQTERSNQGFNREGINPDSDLKRWYIEAFTTMFSSAASVVVSGAEAGMQALKEEEEASYWKAFEKTFEYVGYEVSRRTQPEAVRTSALDKMREDGGVTLFGKYQPAIYANNQQSDRVRSVMDTYQAVANQLSVENDGRDGQLAARNAGVVELRRIQDPKVRRIAETIHNQLGKGQMNRLTTEIADNRQMLQQLDASKSRMPAGDYHRKKVEFTKNLHDLTELQEAVISNMEVGLKSDYGVSFEDAVALIGQSLGR